jgi:hypothetical protein
MLSAPKVSLGVFSESASHTIRSSLALSHRFRQFSEQQEDRAGVIFYYRHEQAKTLGANERTGAPRERVGTPARTEPREYDLSASKDSGVMVCPRSRRSRRSVAHGGARFWETNLQWALRP